MERKIGEIFEYNGKWYQCVVAIDGCRECSFRASDYLWRYIDDDDISYTNGKRIIKMDFNGNIIK